MKSELTTPYLPPCVLKEELARYFCVQPDWMWANVLTDELLDSWGYDLADVKRKHRLPFFLTRRIYLHFGITDLHEDYSLRISKELEKVGISLAG